MYLKLVFRMPWRDVFIDLFDRIGVILFPPSDIIELRAREHALMVQPDSPAKFLKMAQLYKEYANAYAVLARFDNFDYTSQVKSYHALYLVNRDRYINYQEAA